MDDSLERSINALLDSLDELESPASELGTPVLAASKELDGVIALGPAAVPRLRALLEDQPAKKAAYLAVALARIGDRSALPDLRRLRRRYQALGSKSGWDFAVIGQSNLAIDALEHQS